MSRLKLAFYGDDFTGSTDALEVLAFAGLNCALFLEGADAGDARTLRRARRDRRGRRQPRDDAGRRWTLRCRRRCAALAELAPIVHYKVCSTFDSAPAIGSIGRVIEIARRNSRVGAVPIVAGNPALGRYCLFGNLFARSGTDGVVYRIDRHPIMSEHPVTPMDEADLAVHIARQAPLAIGKLTLPELANRRCAALPTTGHDALLIDSATPEHLTDVGRLLDGASKDKPMFVVGSSGVEYALTQWWRCKTDAHRFASCEGAGPVLVVSASASALTAMQIDAALASGFADVALNARDLVDADRAAAAIDEVAAAAARHARARQERDPAHRPRQHRPPYHGHGRVARWQPASRGPRPRTRAGASSASGWAN